MCIGKIPENFGGFERKRALELLSLVKEAHERFNRAKEDPTWQWEDDVATITVNGMSYDILANLGFAQFFLLKRRRVPFGFIAKQPDTQDIYIVFRGTTNPAEWISNFKFTQESYQQTENTSLCQTLPPNKLGKVHRGFYTTYTRPDLGGLIDWVYDFTSHTNHDSMKDTVEKVLSNPKNCSENSRIFVTGHSLGGALAILATLHIHLSNTIPFKSPILYTFANPRVGDREFSKNFKNIECYRIANSEDIVPMVPIPSLLLLSGRTPPRTGTLSLGKKLFSELDYQHIGIPIYFTLQKGEIPQNHIISTYLEALQYPNLEL